MSQISPKKTTDQSRGLNRALSGFSLGIVVVLGGLLAFHSLTDLDIWFHLRAGRDLLGGAGFPHLNTYSFTNPDYAWLNHEWLFQVLAAWLAPGAPLTSDTALAWNLLRTLLILGIILLLVLGDGNLQRLRRGASATIPAFTALITTFALLLLWPRFNLRPELLSYVLLILLVRETDKFYGDGHASNNWRAPALWRIFALVFVWAQCHGFAALAPVIVLLRILVHPLQRRFDQAARRQAPGSVAVFWGPLVLSLGALSLTPNLWHGLLYPLRALGQLSGETADLRHTVSELVPFLKTQDSLYLTTIAFKASLAWLGLFVLLAGNRIRLSRLLLCLAALAATLANQRNIALYGLTFVLLQTGSLDNWPADWWRRRAPWLVRLYRSGRPTALALTVLVAFAGTWWAGTVISNKFYLSEGVGRRFGTGTTPSIYPRAAARALIAPQSDHTFANLDAAAFLLGTTRARLFVDGRTEAYPKERWQQYEQLKTAGQQANGILSQYGVTSVVLSIGGGSFFDLAAQLLASPTWHLSAAGAGGVLFTTHQRAGQSERDILSQATSVILAEPEPDPTRRADLCLAAANIAQLADDQTMARKALQSGLAAQPDHPALNHNLGNIAMAEAHYAEAATLFGRALATNHRLAGSALNRGVCQLRLRQYRQAIRSFQQAIAINPGEVAGWVNLAVARQANGQTAAAISAMQKAVNLRPHDARLQRQLQAWRSQTPRP